MRDLNEKVAWITGAGTGIGEAAAKSLAAVGMHVVLSGRRTEPLQAVAAAIGRKKLALHGWVYRFESGEVFAFDPSKRDFTLLKEMVVPAVSDLLRSSVASR